MRLNIITIGNSKIIDDALDLGEEIWDMFSLTYHKIYCKIYDYERIFTVF